MSTVDLDFAAVSADFQSWAGGDGGITSERAVQEMPRSSASSRSKTRRQLLTERAQQALPPNATSPVRKSKAKSKTTGKGKGKPSSAAFLAATSSRPASPLIAGRGSNATPRSREAVGAALSELGTAVTASSAATERTLGVLVERLGQLLARTGATQVIGAGTPAPPPPPPAVAPSTLVPPPPIAGAVPTPEEYRALLAYSAALQAQLAVPMVDLIDESKPGAPTSKPAAVEPTAAAEDPGSVARRPATTGPPAKSLPVGGLLQALQPRVRTTVRGLGTDHPVPAAAAAPLDAPAVLAGATGAAPAATSKPAAVDPTAAAEDPGSVAGRPATTGPPVKSLAFVGMLQALQPRVRTVRGLGTSHPAPAAAAAPLAAPAVLAGANGAVPATTPPPGAPTTAARRHGPIISNGHAAGALAQGHPVDIMAQDKDGVHPPPELCRGKGSVRLQVPTVAGVPARLAPAMIQRIFNNHTSFSRYASRVVHGQVNATLAEWEHQRNASEVAFLARVLDVAAGQRLSLQAWDWVEIVIRRMACLEQVPTMGWAVASKLEEQGCTGSLVPLPHLRVALALAKYEAQVTKAAKAE